jgi:hypothetical protein
MQFVGVRRLQHCMRPEGSSTVVFQNDRVVRRQNCPCSRSLSSSSCSCSVRCARPQRARRYSRRRPPRALAACRATFFGSLRSHSAARPHSRAQCIDSCTRLSRNSMPTNKGDEGRVACTNPQWNSEVPFCVLRATCRCRKSIFRCRLLQIDSICASTLLYNVRSSSLRNHVRLRFHGACSFVGLVQAISLTYGCPGGFGSAAFLICESHVGFVRAALTNPTCTYESQMGFVSAEGCTYEFQDGIRQCQPPHSRIPNGIRKCQPPHLRMPMGFVSACLRTDESQLGFVSTEGGNHESQM